MSERLHELIFGMADVDEARGVVLEELESGIDPLNIVDILSRTLSEVGEKYEKGDLFLSELMWIGYLASEITSLLNPYLPSGRKQAKGKIVVGTVKGDIHDIGKNIVVMMLQADGWEVVDLGVDVTPERFVEVVREKKPDVLGLSALLTSTMEEMKAVVEALERSGLRNKVKVIVGGRPVSKEFAEEIRADGYAEDSVKAIKAVKELTGYGK
jgi:5-methyltetrahydrofolate--homocysteine methyltransferase